MIDSVVFLEHEAVSADRDGRSYQHQMLRECAAEITRLRETAGKLHADLYGMQDGSLLKVLQDEVDRLRAIEAALREPPDEVIEAVTRALWQRDHDDYPFPGDDPRHGEDTAEEYVADARAAIKALSDAVSSDEKGTAVHD